MLSTLSPSQLIRHSVRRAIAAFQSRSPRGVSGLEWAPSANFVVHNEHASTSISFAPCTTSRQPARYFWEFRLYGRNPLEPILVRRSDVMELHGQQTIESADLCRESGLPQLFHYCEVMAYSPDVTPRGVSSVLVSYHHFRSTDGSFDAHLPAAYIWGAARFTRTEQFHYENFPAAQCTADSRIVVITLNPFVRPVNVWIRLVGADGRSWEDGPFRIAGKGLHRWESAHAPLDTLVSPVGVLTRSDSKTASFVGSIDVPSGRMTNLEHMHPFFAA